jgi:hypothetical protein
MAVYLLCRENDRLGPHVGTFDVDLVFDPALWPGKPPLSDRLDRMDLRPDHGDRHSMYWFADVEPGVSVPIDLLAPKPSEQSPEEVYVAGIRAWCPPGTGAVLEAPVRVIRDGTAWGQGPVRGINITVAGGPALVMAKARSFKDRAYGLGREIDLAKAGKHAYDLFYLVTSYAAGRASLVSEWRGLAHHHLKGKTLEILTDEFDRESSLGSTLAASFIRANGGESGGIAEMISQQVKLFVDNVK